jgi:hypothetical protein
MAHFVARMQRQARSASKHSHTSAPGRARLAGWTLGTLMDLRALARRLSQPQPAAIAWQAWTTAARERRAIAILWPLLIRV